MADQPEPPAATPEPPPENRPSGAAVPRRHITAERQVQAGAPGYDAQLADLTNTVRALAQHVAGDMAVEPETAPDRSGRRVKKFTRSGVNDERTPPPARSDLASGDDATSAPPPPRETRRTDDVDFIKSVAWPREGQAEAAEAQARMPNRRNRRKKKVALLGLMGSALALLVLGYLVGRSDAPPAESAAGDTNLPKTNAPSGSGIAYKISERDLEALNQALHAARTGDQAAARKFFDDSLEQRLGIPGLEYRAAWAALEANDAVTADIHLDRSNNANEAVANSCYIRARFAAQKGKYSEVVRQFQQAARAEPLNGKFFFYWAEALRRAGKTQQAIEVFEQARDRPRTAAQDELYLFKQGLAKAENGQDNAFNSELANHLKEQPVDGGWLMLAAARDLSAGNHKEAADFLRQAANALPPATYNLWIKDFLFQTGIDDPLLTALLRRPPIPNSMEPQGALLDPAVGAPELMDPAIWPVGTAAK